MTPRLDNSPAPAIDRFTRKYRVADSGCWQWFGAISADGYARILIAGRNTLAHRWSYEHFVGPIPDGLTIDHACRNRACVNPAHLRPMTFAENVRGRDTSRIGWTNREKTHCKRGHPLTRRYFNGGYWHRRCDVRHGKAA